MGAHAMFLKSISKLETLVAEENARKEVSKTDEKKENNSK